MSPDLPTPSTLPQSGYLLEHLYANDLRLSVERPAEGAADVPGVRFAWDWEIIDASSFEVRLSLGFDPTLERFEKVDLTLSGRFRVAGESPSVAFDSFVRLHAVAILFPYAREMLSAITARGFYGPMMLPALNVMQLMQDKDMSVTTGARQLAEGTPPPGTLSLPVAADLLPESRVPRPSKPGGRSRAKRGGTSTA